jgi:chemotaxis protein CheD
MIKTLLGSCVGITFWDPESGVAALCHPMLPIAPIKQKDQLSLAAGRRYVDYAIRDLARQFDGLRIRRREIQVKLFGGGDVLLVSTSSSRPTVGRLNSEAAIRVLEEEGFQVVASSLGGSTGLHILFHAGTGEVLLRRLG